MAQVILGLALVLLFLVLTVITIIGTWKLFQKAGKPGWACLVPVYNYVVWLQVAQKPDWWIIILLLVPIANIVFIFMMMIAVAERFGKSPGFGVGMVLLGFIFIPLLGFSKAEYAPLAQQQDSLV